MTRNGSGERRRSELRGRLGLVKASFPYILRLMKLQEFRTSSSPPAMQRTLSTTNKKVVVTLYMTKWSTMRYTDLQHE